MPVERAIELGLLNAVGPRPAWICFLSTTGHLITRFGQIKEQERARPAPAARDASDAFFGALLALVKPSMESRYMEIDVQLMQLQRREVLWQAVIGSESASDSVRSAESTSLRRKIDEEWQRYYFTRPLE